MLDEYNRLAVIHAARQRYFAGFQSHRYRVWRKLCRWIGSLLISRL